MSASTSRVWYPDRMTEILNMLSCLRQLRRETHIDLRVMEREQENFHIQCNQYEEINGQFGSDSPGVVIGLLSLSLGIFSRQWP